MPGETASPNPSFAELVRERRSAAGLSQARLGQMVGRAASTIRSWERGQTTPRGEVLDAVVAVLGVSDAELAAALGLPARPGDLPVDGEATAGALVDLAHLEEFLAVSAAEAPSEGPPAAETPTLETLLPEKPVPTDEPTASYDVEEVLAEQAAVIPDVARRTGTLGEVPAVGLPVATSDAPEPPVILSYLEDPTQRRLYQRRAIVTEDAADFLALVRAAVVRGTDHFSVVLTSPRASATDRRRPWMQRPGRASPPSGSRCRSRRAKPTGGA